jgi:hypothetical protein
LIVCIFTRCASWLLASLAATHAIPSTIYVGQRTVGDLFVYDTYDTADAVPKDQPFVAGALCSGVGGSLVVERCVSAAAVEPFKSAR